MGPGEYTTVSMAGNQRVAGFAHVLLTSGPLMRGRNVRECWKLGDIMSRS